MNYVAFSKEEIINLVALFCETKFHYSSLCVSYDTRQSLSSLGFVVINGSRHPFPAFPALPAREKDRKKDDGRAVSVTLWSRRNSGCDLIFSLSPSLSLSCVSERPVSYSRGRGRAKRVSWLVGRRVERANSRGGGRGIPTGVSEDGNGQGYGEGE